MKRKPELSNVSRKTIDRSNGEPGWDCTELVAGMSHHSIFSLSTQFRTKGGHGVPEASIAASQILDSPCLSIDHGISLCEAILSAELWEGERTLSDRQFQKLRERLRGTTQEHLFVFELKNSDCDRKIIWQASKTYANVFLQPLSNVWIAAHALGYCARGEFYAFGYLVAELDQRVRNEENFMRGQSVIDGSKKSAAERNAKHSELRRQRFRRMSDLIPEIGVDSAAAQCESEGLGGWQAIKRQWNRHKGKSGHSRRCPED